LLLEQKARKSALVLSPWWFANRNVEINAVGKTGTKTDAEWKNSQNLVDLHSAWCYVMARV
jgi:hypothetical protein